jgi:high potential iron-sulfur protein
VSDVVPDPQRRGLFKAAAVTVILGAGLAATQARAAATTPKSDVKYQNTPNGEQHCSVCASFIADPAGGGGPGTCKIVQGPIPQNGWCVLFAARR